MLRWLKLTQKLCRQPSTRGLQKAAPASEALLPVDDNIQADHLGEPFRDVIYCIPRPSLISVVLSNYTSCNINHCSRQEPKSGLEYWISALHFQLGMRVDLVGRW